MRTVCALHCLRSDRVFPAVRRALAASSRGDFRITHFSAQGNHIHLLVEAETTLALARGLRGLAIRTARAINRALGRRGTVWDGRYHARALTTPRALRFALVDVLANFRKHHAGERGIDRCSSGPWFEGWRERRGPHLRAPAPVVRARTWLAAVGWQRHGLIGIEERPRGVP